METKEANGRETEVRSGYSSPRTKARGPQTAGTTLRARKECSGDILKNDISDVGSQPSPRA